VYLIGGDNPRTPVEDLRPIAPVRRPLADKRVGVPASKSIANRELVLSALAHGRSRIDLGPLDPGDDVAAMVDALVALGYRVRWKDREVAVEGGSAPARAGAAIDARGAGTVARFCAALAAVGTGYVTITGSSRMRERPMAPLVRALRDLGATVKGDNLPLTIVGPIHGGRVDVAGNESSQFASALLLVGPRLDGGLRVRIVGAVVSEPFVQLTIASLRARGAHAERTGNEIVVRHGRLRSRALRVPGDVTAATYPAAAAAVLGGAVTVENVDARVREGGQGDARFFELLREMGCAVSHRSGAVAVRRTGDLYGVRANVRDCSDVFPSLSVIATQATGATELTGIGHTRKQESDRVKVVADGINALGGSAQAFADAIRIEPRPLHDGIVDASGDHRIAMAFSILGLQVPGVAVRGASAVSKTFPEFYAMLAELSR
jgi:3-phosphoshikimate 1-carboxyvinyltransferase